MGAISGERPRVVSTVSHYARHVQSEEYRESRKQKAELIYAVCAGYLESARCVADLGAGTGLIKRVLEERSGRPIVGFEIDREFMEETSRMVLADLTKLPVADGAIEFGIANHVYEHVGNLDLFFAEIRRALAPDGRVYLTAGNRFALIEPHYRLPTLSWWPEPVATRILRWSGRGERYDDIHFVTHRRLVAAAARHGLWLEDVTDGVLASQLHRYGSRPGQLASRFALRLPGGLRRLLLRWASPQWFFFIRHAGVTGGTS
jgi:SAM-dependent methyltransferase